MFLSLRALLVLTLSVVFLSPATDSNTNIVSESDTAVYDVAVKDDYVCCCVRDGLVILDIADVTAPAFVRRLDIPGAETVTVYNDHAFIGCPKSGFHIVDITDPRKPFIAGTIGITGNDLAIAPDADYAYVTSGDLTFHIYDIRDVSSPQLVSSVETRHEIHSIAAVNGYVYVASAMRLEVYDAADPADVKTIHTDYYAATSIKREILIRGNHLFMTEFGYWRIYNITDPSNSHIMISKWLNLSDTDVANKCLCSTDEYACVILQHRGVSSVYILDLIDTDSYDKLTEYRSDMTISSCVSTGDHVILSGGTGLEIIDLSTVRRYDAEFSVDTPGTAHSISGGTSGYHIADGQAGIQKMIFDGKNEPVLSAFCDTPGYAYDINYGHRYKFVADGENGIVIVNLKAEENERIYMHFDTPEPVVAVSRFEYNDVYAAGNGPRIFLVPDPERYGEMTKLMTYNVGGQTTGIDYYRLSMLEEYAVITDYTGSVKTVNMIKSGTVVADSHATFDHALDLVKEGSYAHVITSSGIEIFDIADPYDIVRIGSLSLTGDLHDIYRRGERLYVAAGTTGVIAVDISDRSNPQYLYTIDTPGTAMGLWVDDEFIFVADGECGVHIMAMGVNPPIKTGSYDGPFMPVSVDRDDIDTGKECSPYFRSFPNPFNNIVTIEFSIPEPSDVMLSVYSISGQKIVTLLDDNMPAGKHAVQFDGADLASGLYFYRLETDGAVMTGKMTLVK